MAKKFITIYPIFAIGLFLFVLSCTKKDSGPLVITFANISDSLKNQPISFFVSVSKIPDSYLWDFADGTTSTEVSPKHTFKEMGTYNVSCLVRLNGEAYQAAYKLLIKGDPRLIAPRHFSGTYSYNETLYSLDSIYHYNRVIPDTVLTFTWTNPFELQVLLGRMLLDHDTGIEVQYQTPHLPHIQQYLRYYPANDSIYIQYSGEEIPGISGSSYTFTSKK